MDLPRSPFPSTRWTLVACAADHASEAGRATALNDLLSIYRPALHAHAVATMRINPAWAEDLVQGFILEKILERDILARADRTKGRFRSFLLKAFSHYVVSQIRREHAEKRGPSESRKVSLDDNPDLVSYAPDIDRAYNVAWARQILSQALQRMQNECREKKRDDLWGVFYHRVVAPTLQQESPMAYDQFVEKFGYESPDQAFNALVTAKRMFRRVLEEVVRDTVASEDLVNAEIRDLRRILSACAGSVLEMRSKG